MPESGFVTPITLLIAWGLGFIACCWFGRKHRLESGASRSRLLAVAALLSTLALTPLLLPLLLGEKLDVSWGRVQQVVETEDGGFRLEEVPGAERTYTRSGALPVEVAVAALAWLMCMSYVLSSLRPVARFFHRSGELPPLEDAGVAARVRELAASVGARPPRLLHFGSASASPVMNAATGGLLAPVMVATDGILERVAESERDAIIAHELAHIARRSIWLYLLLGIASILVGVLASAYLFPAVCITMSLALVWTVRRAFGHFDEPASDLRAARAVGFPTMASALDKIHAPMDFGGGRLKRLIHATQTHPSRDVRLQSLASAAPAADRPSIPVDAQEVARQRRVQTAVLAIVLAIFGFACWAGVEPALKWAGVGALALTILVPPLLIVVAVLGDLVFAFRMGSIRIAWRRLVRFLALVMGVALLFVGLLDILVVKELEFVWVFAPAGAVVIGLTWSLGRRKRKLLDQIDLAFRSRDFERALELHASLPRSWAAKRSIRCDRAEALALAGHTDEAIRELEEVARAAPKYLRVKLRLAVVLRVRDTERALQFADGLATHLPNHPYILALRAGLLRRLGRVDEACELAERAMKKKPTNGRINAIAARVHVTARNLETASTFLAEAERREPGDAFMALVRAELALAENSPDAGRLIENAVEASTNNPFAWLQDDVRELEDGYRSSNP